MPTARRPCVVIQGGDERARARCRSRTWSRAPRLGQIKDRQDAWREAARRSSPVARRRPGRGRAERPGSRRKEREPWPRNPRGISRRSRPRPPALLGRCFTRAGYELVAPAMIQPAGLFLDVVGEASARAHLRLHRSRRRGAVPAPRPHRADLPPLSRAPPARDAARATAITARRSATSRGATAHTRASSARPASSPSAPPTASSADADARADRRALRAGLPGSSSSLRIGDLGLFAALLDALPMPERWRRRLRHQFWRPRRFAPSWRALPAAGALKATASAARADRALDPARCRRRAEDLVAEHLEPAGLDAHRHAHARRNRRAAARAGRRLRARRRLPRETAALIEDYVHRGRRAARRRRVAHDRGKAPDRPWPALDAFQRRLDLLERAGIDIGRRDFSAEFGRNLEYYTGFVFEMLADAAREPVAGGGRYDGLLPTSARRATCRRSARAIHTERLLAVCRGRAMSAQADPRDALQGPADGAVAAGSRRGPA